MLTSQQIVTNDTRLVVLGELQEYTNIDMGIQVLIYDLIKSLYIAEGFQLPLGNNYIDFKQNCNIDLIKEELFKQQNIK